MVMSLYLRRTRLGASPNPRYEYLFLPVEADEMVPDDQMISPMIPGTNATNIFGTTSPNFLLDLGQKTMSVRMSGNNIDLDTGHYPGVLTGSSYYLLGDDNIRGDSDATIDGYAASGITATVSQTPAVQTSAQQRVAILEFYLSQSVGASVYKDFRLGYPNFVANSPVTTITGVSTTLFRGLLRAPRFSRTNGVEGQLPLNLTWRVGKSP